jgi:hypothetical protein
MPASKGRPVGDAIVVVVVAVVVGRTVVVVVASVVAGLGAVDAVVLAVASVPVVVPEHAVAARVSANARQPTHRTAVKLSRSRCRD